MRKSLVLSFGIILIFAASAMAEWWAEPSVFEATYYADHNADVREKVGYDYNKLLNHWRKYGLKEGRKSSPVFDAKYYLNNNPDVAKAVGKNYLKAANHWYKNGRREGRSSHPDFDVKSYLKLNQDVVRKYGQHNYVKAIDHYLTIGFDEGRQGR